MKGTRSSDEAEDRCAMPSPGKQGDTLSYRVQIGGVAREVARDEGVKV